MAMAKTRTRLGGYLDEQVYLSGVALKDVATLPAPARKKTQGSVEDRQRQRIADLSRELDKVVKERAVTEAALRDALEGEKGLVNELVAELEKFEVDKDKAEKALATSSLECRRLANLATELQETVRIARMGEQSARDVVADRDAQIKEVLERLEAARAEVSFGVKRAESASQSEARLRLDLAERAKEVERLRQEVSTLSAEASSRSRHAVEQAGKLAELQAQVDRAAVDKAALADDVTALKAQLSSSEAEVARLAREEGGRRASVKALQQELEQATYERAQLARELADVRDRERHQDVRSVEEASRARAELRRAAEEIASLSAARDEAVRAARQERETADKERKGYLALQQAADEAAQAHARALAETRSRAGDLEKSLEIARSEAQMLRDKVDRGQKDSEHRLAILQSKYETLQRVHQEVSGQFYASKERGADGAGGATAGSGAGGGGAGGVGSGGGEMMIAPSARRTNSMDLQRGGGGSAYERDRDRGYENPPTHHPPPRPHSYDLGRPHSSQSHSIHHAPSSHTSSSPYEYRVRGGRDLSPPPVPTPKVDKSKQLMAEIYNPQAIGLEASSSSRADRDFESTFTPTGPASGGSRYEEMVRKVKNRRELTGVID